MIKTKAERHLFKTFTWTILLLVIACSPVKRLSYINYAHLYNLKNEFTEPKIELYHKSDSVSQVFVLVKLHELLYAKEEGEDFYKANFNLHYKLFPSYESTTILDSATHVYVDSTHFDEETEMIVDFDVQADFPGTYQLEINLTDLNRKQSFLKVINVDKKRKDTPMNYLLTDTMGLPLFRKYLEKDETFYIQANTSDPTDLTVRYFSHDFSIATPPFTSIRKEIFNFDPDSIFNISIVNTYSDVLNFPAIGIFHIQQDTSVKSGLTLFRFEEGFPEVETPEQALEPLRYLTTSKEYDELKNNTDYKASIDSFWLERGHNPERAKAMIQKYYNRVEEANREFTSYHEGWKTDRGIIYIIFGPPTIVYRSSETEEWTYGEEGNILSINYVFVKINNPFTDNDYRLVKSPSYKQLWYLGVEGWRR